MKKIIYISLILLCFNITACDKKIEKEEILNNNETNNNENLDTDLKTIYDKAISKDSNLEYIGLLGKQIVAGTNYMFLCKKNDTYKIVIVYYDLEGNSTLIRENEFNPYEYINKNYELNEDNLQGGWYVEKPNNIPSIDGKIKKYFDDSNETMTGASYYPLVVVARWENNGTNYAILCYGEGSYKGSRTKISILTLNVNENDESEIVSIADIDLKKYNK